MTYNILIPLAAFAFVSSITPGPNNLMLMASGANYGFRRSLRHMFGISIGFMVMVVLVGSGLVQVFNKYPVSYTVLKTLSVGYLLYLSWKIATSAPPKSERVRGKPFGFFQAALFQWVNPKAWAMALTATTAYLPSQTLASIILVALVFGAVNLPSVSFWAILGQQMRKILTNPLRLRLFNYSMAGLLLASLAPVLTS